MVAYEKNKICFYNYNLFCVDPLHGRLHIYKRQGYNGTPR